jgi:hypothetical protein
VPIAAKPNTLIVTVEVSFQLRTPRDDAQGTVICRTPRVQSKKREPCYFMFFRINVAIVVRTDFSSVFINQTCLSFEFKRLKLDQHFAIS